jgi:TRAP-type transport system small permease protein
MLLIKKIIRVSCEISAKIGMAAIFILLLLTVGDVIGRFIFNHPIPGTFELTKILFALSVFFSLSVSQYRGENLGITLIYDRCPLRVRGLMDIFSSILSIGTFSTAFVQTIKYAIRMKNANTVTSVLRWPMYPWIIIASIGIVVLVLALLLDFSAAVKEIKGEEKNES